MTVHFRILGPVEIEVDGACLHLGGPRQRSLLALLLTEADRVVSVNRMVDAFWGDDAGDTAVRTVQVHVSNLRKMLRPAAAALGLDELVLTQPPGYRLVPGKGEVDLHAFEAQVTGARQSARAGDPAGAVRGYRKALRLWRGPPLADLGDEPFAQPIAVRLTRLHAAVIEEVIEAELARGRHVEVLDELEAQVSGDPLNERLRGLLMIGLYRAGRQAAALDSYQEARRALADELGLEPGPDLRELEGRILAHDPSLRPPPVGQPDLEVSTMLRSSVVAPRAVLLVNGKAVDIRQPVTTIGRRSDCHVVLDDPKASRAHAEIRTSAHGFVVVDCGSTNGTRVNGRAVREHPVGPEDEILIGNSRITIHLPDL